MRTADLTDGLLDYWTARAEKVPAAELVLRNGQCYRQHHDAARQGGFARTMNYSTNWALTGPLVEKHEMEFRAYAANNWVAGMPKFGFHKRSPGDAAMIAICRAVVRAAFGDEVDDLEVVS